MGKRDPGIYDNAESTPSSPQVFRRRRTAIVSIALLGAAIITVVMAIRTWSVSQTQMTAYGVIPCRYGEWSEPSVISRPAFGSPLRNPTLVAGSGQAVYLVGHFAPMQASPQLPGSSPSPLFSLDIRGRPLGAPSGNLHFLDPIATRGLSGKFHLFWEEEESATKPLSADRQGLSPMSIWHATYDSSVGWSASERIYLQPEDDTPLRWNADDVGTTIDSEDRLHLVVSHIGMRQMLHLTLNRGAWKVGTLPARGMGGNIAAGPRGRLYMTYIARGASGHGPANDVLMIQSNDAGNSWSSPITISSLGYNRATNARVLANTTGVVHLLWGQNLSGGLFPQVVRHIVSHDGGREWSEPDDLPLPEDGLSKWNAVLDSCGSVHVVINSVVAGKPDASGKPRPLPLLSYARWSGSWSKARQLFSTSELRDVKLAANGDGIVYLVGAAPHTPITEHDFDVVVSALHRMLPATTFRRHVSR